MIFSLQMKRFGHKKYGKAGYIFFLFCDLHTLLEYGKAGVVAKNLLIIDLCSVDPVRA